MKLCVYGPGGPFNPVRECAGIFSGLTGIETIVSKGVSESWIAEATRDGGVIYMGAEYMMSDFISEYQGVIDAKTVDTLYRREVGIISRKHNPRGIKTLADLGRPGMRVLDVRLENMGKLQASAPGINENIKFKVETGQDGFDAWLSAACPDIDAWITYKSWHFPMRESSEFVSLPDSEKIFRATPVGITAAAGDRYAARQFIDFMKSGEGHSVFRKYGWE